MGDKDYSYKSSGTNDQVCEAINLSEMTLAGRAPLTVDPRAITTAPATTARTPRTRTRTTTPTSELPFARRSSTRHADQLPRDGSYYYSNPNGSTYHNDGQGNSTYTSPSGYQTSSSSGNSGSSSSKK
jgi:hypothetical protein